MNWMAASRGLCELVSRASYVFVAIQDGRLWANIIL